MWRVRRSFTNALVSDMFCSPNARKPAALKSKGSDQFAESDARFRTRNLALRLSAIEWTDSPREPPVAVRFERF